MQTGTVLRIGTCSWKYDSWVGLIYSDKARHNYLQEYSRHYPTVEIDQWFWSLFPGSEAKLPSERVVNEYATSVPDDFRFSIKVPNSITLTHYYSQKEENPHFLSNRLFDAFLERLSGMKRNLGPLLFQFEYLNKQKMPTQQMFQDRLGTFLDACPKEYPYAVEIRNPNYLNKEYFAFLTSQNMHYVFLQGYYMPSIFEVYQTYKEYLQDLVVIRLHGPDRKEIEQKTQKSWNEIVNPRDGELSQLSDMLMDLKERNIAVYVNVNNHYEGSAPKTIQKIKANLER